MASRNFSHLAAHLARGLVDYSSDNFKAIIVSSVPTESNLDTWDFLNDVTNQIPNGGGYTAGGFVVNASVGSVDAANNRVAVTFSAANPTYTDSTISGVGCIIYKDTGTANTSPLLHFVDWGQTVASTNGNFVVTFSTPFYINASA